MAIETRTQPVAEEGRNRKVNIEYRLNDWRVVYCTVDFMLWLVFNSLTEVRFRWWVVQWMDRAIDDGGGCGTDSFTQNISPVLRNDAQNKQLVSQSSSVLFWVNRGVKLSREADKRTRRDATRRHTMERHNKYFLLTNYLELPLPLQPATGRTRLYFPGITIGFIADTLGLNLKYYTVAIKGRNPI